MRLRELSKRLAGQTGIEIALKIHDGFPNLAREDELVVYRVAQEALTNVLRHAQARHVLVRLEPFEDLVRLCVVDDGVGLDGSAAGGGMRGMRERALSIGAALELESGKSGGVMVSLDVPVQGSD